MPFLSRNVKERIQRSRHRERKDEVFGVGGEEVMNEVG